MTIDIVTNLALISLGLAILIIAGDLLVRGAVNLATILKISPLIVGLTVVAFGTSAPELMVTLKGVASDNYQIAMGNIIGSNIANVLLVLGLPSLIYAFGTQLPGLKRDAAAMLLATALFIGFIYVRGILDPLSACVFLGFIFLYIVTLFLRARRSDGAEVVIDEIEEYTDNKGLAWKTPAYIIIGLIGLPLGAKLLIEHGATLASDLGVRPELIGLTIVAIGTSLPEFATVFAAALRKQADVAVGNVVGSNIFNLMFVGGAAGIVWNSDTSAYGVPNFSVTSRTIDMPVMLLSTLILAYVIFRGGKIGKRLGLGMFAVYIAYIAFIGVSGISS